MEHIIRDMSEGLMTVSFEGVITTVNEAALQIFAMNRKDVEGQSLAGVFFGQEENDAFLQTMLEAVYDETHTYEGYAPFFNGKRTRQLHIRTSVLNHVTKSESMIVVLNDLTELIELQDAMKAMQEIKRLNRKLSLRNKLLNETFGRFLSDEIVHELLETPDGLKMGGRMRPITVLMSDLRGFAAMSERLGPEKMLAMLNHYLTEMTRLIEAYNGTIIEFLGDGILAIFGAPTPNEKHASDAAACAISMQKAMPRINTWNKENGYEKLIMGIGINSGDAIVGLIGSETRTKYGAMGGCVNLAGRVESYTSGGDILITPYTRERIKEELITAKKFPAAPKGITGTLLLTQITGIGAPYDVSYDYEDPAMRFLKKPLSVDFYRIFEKHRERDPQRGYIAAMSESEALLFTEIQLSAADNIEIEIPDPLFAKVKEQRNDWTQITFTGKPPEFEKWVSEHMEGATEKVIKEKRR